MHTRQPGTESMIYMYVRDHATRPGWRVPGAAAGTSIGDISWCVLWRVSMCTRASMVTHAHQMVQCAEEGSRVATGQRVTDVLHQRRNVRASVPLCASSGALGFVTSTMQACNLHGGGGGPQLGVWLCTWRSHPQGGGARVWELRMTRRLYLPLSPPLSRARKCHAAPEVSN